MYKNGKFSIMSTLQRVEGYFNDYFSCMFLTHGADQGCLECMDISLSSWDNISMA